MKTMTHRHNHHHDSHDARSDDGHRGNGRYDSHDAHDAGHRHDSHSVRNHGHDSHGARGSRRWTGRAIGRARGRVTALLAGLVAWLALSCVASTAIAVNVSIVATVNGRPITNYDVEQRVAFLEYATNIQASESNSRRLYEDALQLLVNDTLRLDAALRIAPNVEAVLLPQVREFMNQNFGENDKSGARVLREAGIDPVTVQRKYLSDIAWQGYIGNNFAEKFENLDDKIDTELERITANAARPQLRLGEIVLVPGPSRDLQQTRLLAEDMVSAIRSGANFQEVARQYSVAGTAAQGGDVGWTITEKLPEAFRAPLADVNTGGVTDPILLDGAIYILRSAGERKDGFDDSSQSRVWLARALLPVSENASDAERLLAGARIEADTEDIVNCAELAKLNAEYGSGSTSLPESVILADLAPQLQELISSLTVGEPSPPLGFEEGIASLMLCRIEVPRVNLPGRDEIRQSLVERVFVSVSERQFLRLRRTAVIERRDS